MKLADLAQKVKISSREPSSLAWEKQDEWQRRSRGYVCTLSYQGRRMSTNFWMGKSLANEPTSYDVLSSLLSDASTLESSSSFEDWANELGLDPDSRKTLQTYRLVELQTNKLKRLLGHDYDKFFSSEPIGALFSMVVR